MCKDGIRVVIADDEPITRMDLKELLSEEGYQVVGEAADGFDAVEACKPSIELAVARSKDMRKLRKDMEQVSERLENRSIIEKAKGLVMTQEGMTEQDAYDYIRKLSQTKNLSMRRVSEIILLKSGG